jgi:hypothetical protein
LRRIRKEFPSVQLFFSRSGSAAKFDCHGVSPGFHRDLFRLGPKLLVPGLELIGAGRNIGQRSVTTVNASSATTIQPLIQG